MIISQSRTHGHMNTHTTHGSPAQSLQIRILAGSKTPLKEKCRQTRANYRPTYKSMGSHIEAEWRQSFRAHADCEHAVLLYMQTGRQFFYTCYKYKAGQDHKRHCRRMEMCPGRHRSSRACKQQIHLPNWVISMVIKGTARMCT